MPDYVDVIARVSSYSRIMRAPRIPGKPFGSRPAHTSIRAFPVIDFIISRSIIMPDYMDVAARVNGYSRMI